MPIDDLFNFDDGTPQGWKKGNVNIGSIVCACQGTDNPPLASDGGVLAHSPPYSVRAGCGPAGTDTFGMARLYDFRLIDKIIITNWVFSYYYSHDFWNLRCFDCDTFAEVFTQYIKGFTPGTWREYVNNVSSQCKGRRVCVTFSKGSGSDDLYWDDIRIQAWEPPAGAAMGHGAMLQWILALPYSKRFPRLRPLRI